MRKGSSSLPSTAAGFAGFFFLLCAISVVRPVRDQAGIARGVAALPRMFGLTFLAVLAGALLLAWLASRVPRARYVPIAFRIFAAGLLITWMALRAAAPWAQTALFVWSSAWSLFSVSLFWGLLTDLYGRGAAARLFGVIAAGGTAGTLAGPILVQWLARPLGPANLIPISALLLELSVQSASALRRTVAVPAAPAPPRSRIRDALGALLRPSLLRALSGYVLLFTATATLFYFEQARMVARTTADDRERTLLFARVDLAVNATTLALQAFVTRPFLQRAGLRVALSVYRGGDALAAWLAQALPPGALFPAALALCALWLVNAVWLSRGAGAGLGSAQ